MAERMFTGAAMAFNEDRAAKEIVHRGVAAPATPDLNLGLDAGAMQFRNLVEQMIVPERVAKPG
jgi:vanillate O-demethylase monooxygenase subunit